MMTVQSSEVVNLSCGSWCTALKVYVILSHIGLESYWVGARVGPFSEVFSHIIGMFKLSDINDKSSTAFH